MDDAKKMFRDIMNGQSALKSELLTKIGAVDTKVDMVREDMVGLENRLTKRIDKIGLNLARPEDDTPTLEEFDKLENRVTKVEEKAASI